MRYEVGQSYVFIHCKYSFVGHRTRMIESGLYKPWSDTNKLENLEAANLLCIEHHKVPSEHDPKEEPTCDGFVFAETLPDGKVLRWNNQYPNASYGQISTDQDQVVHLDGDSTGMEMEDMLDKAFMDPKFKSEMRDGRDFLSNIRRGWVTIEKSPQWSDTEKKEAVESLKKFEAVVQDKIETVMQKKLKILQVMYLPADGGETILMDWFQVVFEDEPSFNNQVYEEGRGRRQLVEPVGVKA